MVDSIEGNFLLVVADLNSSMLNSPNSPENGKIEIDHKSFYDQLYNKNIISVLANQGNQPFAELLSKQFRLMFLQANEREPQRAHLVNFLHRYFLFMNQGVVQKPDPDRIQEVWD